jgi:hypothetical protein
MKRWLRTPLQADGASKAQQQLPWAVLRGFQEHREEVLRQSHLLPRILREHLAIMRGQERQKDLCPAFLTGGGFLLNLREKLINFIGSSHGKSLCVFLKRSSSAFRCFTLARMDLRSWAGLHDPTSELLDGCLATIPQ